MKNKSLIVTLLVLFLTVSVLLLTGCGCKHSNLTWKDTGSAHCQVCDDCEKIIYAWEDHQWQGTTCSVCDVGSQYTQGLEYELSSNMAYYQVIGKGTFEGDTLDISPTFDGKPVRRIARNAFSGNRFLKQVVLPNSIEYLGESAFNACDLLEKVDLPLEGSLQTIGTACFANNTNLTAITLPATLTDVKASAFANSSACTIYCQSASKPNGWASNWNSNNNPVVWNCNSNSTATDGRVYVVEQGVRYAIANNTATVTVQPQALLSAHIVSSVSHNGRNYNVTAIENNAFKEVPLERNDLRIQQVTFDSDSKIVSVGAGAFDSCIALQSITLPDTVETLGEGAFRHCWELQSFVIPSKVTTISAFTFASCYSLKEITIPQDVTFIGTQAFVECNSLEKFVVQNPNGWSIKGLNIDGEDIAESISSDELSNEQTAVLLFTSAEKYLYCDWTRS